MPDFNKNVLKLREFLLSIGFHKLDYYATPEAPVDIEGYSPVGYELTNGEYITLNQINGEYCLSIYSTHDDNYVHLPLSPRTNFDTIKESSKYMVYTDTSAANDELCLCTAEEFNMKNSCKSLFEGELEDCLGFIRTTLKRE